MVASSKTEWGRFCRLYALGLVAFAAFVGMVTTVQFVLAAREPVQRYAAQFLFHDTIRTLAPAASGSALLLALLLWAHPLAPRELQASQGRVLRWAAAVALPGYLVAGVTAVVAGFVVLLGVFRQPRMMLGFGSSVVTGWDFWTGSLATVTDTLLILFLAQRYLGRLQAGGMSLPAKLIIVVTVTVGLRASVGLVLSSLVSA